MRHEKQRVILPDKVLPALRLLMTLAVICVCLKSPLEAHSQANPATKTSAPATRESDAEKTLIAKAKALEARGRPDIAVQVWQQILASDPNNPLALEGVARDYRLSGNSAASEEALEKLRKINPGDPNINSIQGLSSNKSRDARLAQAGALAKAGHPEAAMQIYREYYGDHPPDGDIYLAYYETLYSTPNGKAEAIAAIRAGAARNPGDERFIVTLGRMLTYDSHTRAEGIKILREHSSNYDAQNAYRQALIWDSANPASAQELKQYLKDHPKDSELESRLKENEVKLAEMNAGIARTPNEKAAFAALNAHDLPQAEGRFMAMLDKDPNDPRAAAGMGFVRMQQNNFADAISYLTQAETNGFRDSSVVEGLKTSRFYLTMNEGNTAANAGQLDVAAEKYKAALEMRPRSPDNLAALNGLAGVYVKSQQFSAAAQVYQQIVKLQPNSLDGWRGLFFAYAQDNQSALAMNTMQHFPATVKAAMTRDPGYLQTLASIYQSSGRDADAQRVLAQALSLPFPNNGANLKSGTRLQYAGILMQAKRYDQAAEQYKQVLNDDTGSIPAWMGLVTAEHLLQLDKEAINIVQKMPPATYEAALNDPGFLSMLGSIYAQSNQFEIAQGLLERSVNLQLKSGGQPSLGLETQLASIYLQRNNTAQAYQLYRQVLQAHPDNLDAWRGLIGTLQITNRNAEALEEIKMIPPPVRKQLESNILFVQSEASLYAAAGDTVNALSLFNRVQKYYQSKNQPLPSDVAIQSAYLLYNTKDDRALYPLLMNLGAREDLTSQQRETVQSIWANWSVRRSAAAFDAGNTARAIDILDAAAQAFPDNLQVRKAVAGGYLRAGKNKEALAIYKQVDYQDATAADFQGAISAALAANDKAQAETWLRQALDRYPRDPSILAAAARFEQARGDNARAADYWRASINAMPEISPTDRLAHELVHPEPGPTNGSRPATPADLANLLNPDADPAGKRTRVPLPPLPSYGHDPYDPIAPVVLAPQATTATGTAKSMPETMPVYPVPATNFQVPTTTSVPLPASDLQTPDPLNPEAATQPQPSAQSPTPNSASAQTASNPPVRKRNSQSNKPSAATYTGRMNIPADDENITSTGAGISPNTPFDVNALPAVKPNLSSPNPTQPNAASNTGSTPDTTYPEYPPLPMPPLPPSPNPGSNIQNLNKHDLNEPQTYPQLVPQNAPQPSPRQRLQQPSSQAGLANPRPQNPQSQDLAGLRITSQPMNPLAARAQSLLADQTDGQLTQGFTISYLPNASAGGTPGAPNNSGPGTSQVQNQTPNPPPDQAQSQPYSQPYSPAQYTPSAQDAAAGAYSAQKPINQTPTPPELQPNPPRPASRQSSTSSTTSPGNTALTPKKKRKKSSAPASGSTSTSVSTPTLVTAPGQNGSQDSSQPSPPLPVTAGESQSTTGSSGTGSSGTGSSGTGSSTGSSTGLTDQELEQRNLPPLKGPWLRTPRRQPETLNPRDEAEQQLRTIEGGYSAWLGGTGVIARRTGNLGYDAMTSLEASFEASVPLGTHARLSFIAHPAFLDSGQADGTAAVSLVTTSTTGTVTAPGPEPYGTELGTILTTTPPPQQNAYGVGGEAQLTFGNLAIAGGYTPYGFLVSNWIARANWRPGKGPFTISFNRDSVKDTQLSYAGLRDPGSATAFYPGNIWGGVIANSANIQYSRGDLNSGFYAAAGGQYITGYNVRENRRYDGTVGAYFRVYTLPEYGSLNLGANFFAMHYTTNLQGFSYGMGGYFSPQAYFLANLPITWTGHYLTRWHYNILGSFGVQAFSEDQQSIYPLSPVVSEGTPSLPALTSVGPNYDIRGQVAYALTDHWFIGGFASANNSRDYTNASAGFSVRYLFRSQTQTAAGPTGIFQTDDQHPLRPLTVP